MKQTTTMQNRILFTLAGSFLFCLGMNLFITPVGLYSGGIVGISQILRTLLMEAGMQFPFEISGIINMLFNIPLLVLAYKAISRHFFTLTLLSIVFQMVCFSMIPIPAPFVEDVLTNCVLGGIITGFGCGMILRSSASAGGTDILGFYLTQKFRHFSVGKLNIAINVAIFSVCMVLFSVQTALYSILFTVIFGFVVDKVHWQNISVTAMIFTRHPQISETIMKDLHRGVTYWQGHGAYTQEDTYILVSAISRYEVNYVRSKIKQMDPNAFVIFSESINILGNFEKHL